MMLNNIVETADVTATNSKWIGCGVAVVRYNYSLLLLYDFHHGSVSRVTHMIKYNNNIIINIFIIHYIAETCDLHACRHYYGISCYDEIYIKFPPTSFTSGAMLWCRKICNIRMDILILTQQCFRINIISLRRYQQRRKIIILKCHGNYIWFSNIPNKIIFIIHKLTRPPNIVTVSSSIYNIWYDFTRYYIILLSKWTFLFDMDFNRFAWKTVVYI